MGNTLTSFGALEYNSELMLGMIRATDQAGRTIEIFASKMTQSFSAIGMESTKSGEKTVSSLSKITESLTKLISITKLAKKAFQLGIEGIQYSASQMDQRNKFQTMLGSDEMGNQLYQLVGKRTKQSKVGWKQAEMGEGFSEFMGVTKDLGQVQRLIGLAERLYALKPSLGASHSVGAVKSLLGGDTSKMNEYGITGFEGNELPGMVNSGKVTAAIDLMSERMQAFGATQAGVEKYSDSLSGKLAILGESFQTSLGASMSSVLEAVLPVLEQFADNLSAGKYQPFFELISIGGLIIGQIMNFIADHTELATLAIWLISSALIVLKTVSLLSSLGLTTHAAATAGATAAVGAFNLALLGNPLVWFLGLLITGIPLLLAFGRAANKAGNVSASADLDYSTSKLQDELLKSSMPVQVTNKEPLAVKGNVAINEENLKYLLDVAERDYIAKFSTATVAPVINAYFGDVHETADVDDVIDRLGNKLQEEIVLAAEGAE